MNSYFITTSMLSSLAIFDYLPKIVIFFIKVYKIFYILNIQNTNLKGCIHCLNLHELYKINYKYGLISRLIGQNK